MQAALDGIQWQMRMVQGEIAQGFKAVVKEMRKSRKYWESGVVESTDEEGEEEEYEEGEDE